MKKNNRLKPLKPLIFAIAAALSPAMAQAAVTATQLPGDGTALYGTATATVSGATMTVNVTGEDSAGNTIITWGSSGGTLNPNAATGGFNIGSQASVTFATGLTNNPFVLNVDTTANPTEIAGTLTEQNGIGLGVANANGIIVDGTAVINAPTGLGLLNQGYSSGDLASFATVSAMLYDFANATGGVTIATGATINAAGSVIVAGAGMVNIDAPIDNNGPNINTTRIAATGTVNINAPVTDDGADAAVSPIGIDAPNVNINAPVTVGIGGGGAGALSIETYSLTAPTGGVMTGNVNISSTGSLTGGTVYIEEGYHGASMSFGSVSSIINVTDNGSIVAPYTGGNIYIGGLDYLNGQEDLSGPNGTQGMPAGMIFNAGGTVSGSGYMQADNIDFTNQAGSVNDISTGQILANGFHIVAGPSGTVRILMNPGMSSGSGINLTVTGNANVNELGQAASFTNTGSSATLNLASDYASKLVVQATGTITIGNGNGTTFTSPSGTSYSSFEFPGLVYLLGDQGVTVNAAIDSAYSTSTPMGFGVFLLGPTVTDTYPIIANGDRGVNIESTQYGPTTINGVNVTQGNPNLAPIYFLQAGTGGLSLNTPAPYTTQWQWEAENQVFLVDPNYTGPSYPVNVPQGTVSSSNIFTVTAPATEVVNNLTLPADAFSQLYPALSTVKAANPGVTIGYSVRSVTVVNGVTEVSLAVYTSKGGTLLAAAQENIG